MEFNLYTNANANETWRCQKAGGQITDQYGCPKSLPSLDEGVKKGRFRPLEINAAMPSAKNSPNTAFRSNDRFKRRIYD